MDLTLSYVYKWTHLPTLNWYIGSRTAKGCHPNDGYICSSKIVKPLIQQHPEEWQKTILSTGTPEEMFALETEILQLFDAKNDPRSFNKHNNDINFTGTGKRRYFSEEHRRNIGLASKGRNVGRKQSLEERLKKSQSLKGKPKSEEFKKAKSIAMKGRSPINKGQPSKFKGIPKSEWYKIKNTPEDGEESWM